MKPQNVQCRKSLLGKYEVTYDCPECGASLKNDLDDAGTDDTCPHCECEFTVPGFGYKQEVERRRAERIVEKEARKRESEAKAREAEEKLREVEAKAKEVEANWKRNLALKEKEIQIEKANQSKPTDNRTAIQYISEGLAEFVRALFHSFLCGIFGSVTFVCALRALENGEDTFEFLAMLFGAIAIAFGFASFFAIKSSIEAFEKGSRS